MGARPTLGPNALLGMDTFVGVLVEAGFVPREAVLAATSIVNWAAGFAVFEARQPLGVTATPEELAVYMEDYNGFLGSLPRDEYPMLTHLATFMAECTPDVQFEYALDRLLDGIAAQQARPGSTA
jgi:hypothetical protein